MTHIPKQRTSFVQIEYVLLHVSGYSQGKKALAHTIKPFGFIPVVVKNQRSMNLTIPLLTRMVGEETMSEFVTIFNIQQQFHLVYNFAAVPMFLFNLVIFILCILIYMQSKQKPSFAFIGNLSMIDTMMGAMILFLFLVRSDATEGQHERQNDSVSIHSGSSIL